MADAKDKYVTSLELNLSRALSAAIYIPFKGINLEINSESTSPTIATSPITTTHVITSLDPASKLEKILEYLPQQQDVVRRKMIEIILDQIEEVKRKARSELEQLKFHQDKDLAKEEKERERLEKLEMEEMLRRVKAPHKATSIYELRPDTCFNETYRPLPQKPRQGNDFEMNSGSASITHRSMRQIKYQLAQDMETLFRCGLKELEKYDRHCRSVLQPYESSLARRTTSLNANMMGPKSSSKINSTISQVINLSSAPRIGPSHDVGRLSNGMPVSMERCPARKTESLGELTRRSNK
ncbi:putative powdery mildew-specific protein [Erysiphe neolycopersici]|uniref:Putative powdery mildew-specific protein n=1 Tax=Erysiphe neolycopersici TaxID=212602 RepID=A0A420HWC9_9PEZI|nr:putative powdery mildew-specific protein [Erysiphe neolycopersici]